MRRIKLGAVLDVKRGTSLSGKYYSTVGEKIRLTLGNFNYPSGGFKKNSSKKDIYFIGTVNPEYILCKGDIITPLTEQVSGLLGETATIPENNLYIQSGDIGLVVPDESVLNKRFAYYLISSKSIRSQLGAGAQQTKIRHTSPDKIKDCIAMIPDVNEQKKVAFLLDKLNDKISLNNRIISELESMAKLIYDYWFVQFDFPDENGRPYKSGGGKMVWNDELKREIPEGWEVKTLAFLCDIKSGYPFQANYFSTKGVYKLLTIKNVQDEGITLSNDSVISTLPVNLPPWCKLKPHDILMSLTGNVGRVGIMFDDNYLLNQRVALIAPKPEVGSSYIYFLFKSYYVRNKFESIATGTSQKNLSPVDAGHVQIPYCSITSRMFSKMTSESVSLIVSKMRENQQLASLRDFLLPLLMNGQVTIGEKAGEIKEVN